MMQRKHKTGFTATDDIVNKIIRSKSKILITRDVGITHNDAVTVQTGMITALCATIDLILFLASVSESSYLMLIAYDGDFRNSLPAFTSLSTCHCRSCTQIR